MGALILEIHNLKYKPYNVLGFLTMLVFLAFHIYFAEKIDMCVDVIYFFLMSG